MIRPLEITCLRAWVRVQRWPWSETRFTPRCAWLLSCAVAWALAGAPSASAQSRDEFARLLDGFLDRRFEVREAASRALLAAGAPCVPALRDALDAPDPEVRWRARTLLDALGALDPTPTVQEIRPEGFQGRVRVRFGQEEEDERIEVEINSNGRMLQVIRDRAGEVYYDVDGTRYRGSSDRDMEIFRKLEPELYRLALGFNRRLAPPPVPAPDELRWPTLGARIIETRGLGKGSPGPLTVTSVIPGSPADKIGMREGDRILKVNGQLATRTAHLTMFLARIQIGQGFNLVVIRDDAEVRLEGRRER